MDNKKIPVPEFFYSQGEWDRLGCGPLPSERRYELRRDNLVEDSTKDEQNELDSTIDRRQRDTLHYDYRERLL